MVESLPVTAVAHELALGRYRLGALLGRGATSSVRRALDMSTGRHVAVKTVPADPDLVERVRREVRAASRLDHPNLVRLLDWGRDPDCVRLVWEIVEGPSLKELTAGVRLDDARAGALMADVLDALEHAHARGVIHRDVKPANILVDAEGNARLADFGVARVTGEAALTMVGALVGTVAYMAPEQALGDPASPATDVYAAALVLYELLTGENPLNGGSPAETHRRAARADIPPLRRLRPDLPAPLLASVDAALSADPARRPTARQLADDVRLAASVRRRHGVGRRGGRHEVALTAAAAAALATVCLHRSTDLATAQIAGVAAATGVAAALRPAPVAVAGVVAATVLVSRTSPGLAVVVCLAGLLACRAGWRSPRLLVAAAAAPLAVAVGFGPLALAGLAAVRGVERRLGVAVAGIAATLAWQLCSGDGGLLLGHVAAFPGIDAVNGVDDPLTAARRITEPLRDAHWVLPHAAALAIAGAAAGLVARAAPGGPRVAATALWTAGTVAAIAAVTPDPLGILGVSAPSAMLLAFWALRPWRHLARMGGSPVSATVRGPSS